MSPGPTLLVLAAGLGRRYGGPKQLVGVGPAGETLIDYSVHDAALAGFDQAVFVIRPEMSPAFPEWARARYGRRIRTAVVHQAPGDPGRSKPWGTAHAVLVARSAVSGPFAVVNADDFYGAGAFRSLASFLCDADPDAHRHALVTYRLGDTLSDSGPVNRGICRMGPDGRLLDIEETSVSKDSVLDPDAPVSANCWGFAPSVFGALERGFAPFRASARPDDEYQLPRVIKELVGDGRAEVEVVAASEAWLGMTYPGDRERVAAALESLASEGRYTHPLW